MNRFHDNVDNGLRALIVLLGVWALYAQACVLAQASFATLRAFAWLPLVCGVLVVWKTPNSAQPSETRASVAPRARRPLLGNRLRFGTPFAIAALYAITGLDLLFWLLATCYLTAEVWFSQPLETATEPSRPPRPRLEAAALLALCGLAALLTSGARRPDADDAYYLNVAAAEVESPERAPQSYDALHRSGLPPVEETLHLPETYEILIGLLSSVSGLTAQALYYVVLPPLWAVLGTLATWLVLCQLLPRRGAIVGTAMFVFLLVFWGDGHRTFGNFGFVRLFQGKAVYLMVALPLVILAAFRFRQRPSFATWLTFALSQCAAVGLTTNGVVVAPIAAALAILAPTASSGPSLRTKVTGLTASVPLLVMAAAMYPRLAPYRAATDVDDVLLGYTFVLGVARTPLVLLALTLLPALAARARLKHADWIAGYAWIVVLVMFMPLVAVAGNAFLGHVYSWRLLWAVPVALLVSLAAGIVASAFGELRSWPTAGVVAFAVVFAVAGPMAVSRSLFSFQNLGRLKVDESSYAVAEEIVALARRDAPALVPEAVAVYVAGLPRAPPLIGVRDLYLMKLRGFIPDDQFSSRTALFRYSTGGNGAISVSAALSMIEAEGIATVAFSEAHRDSAALVSALGGRGFAIHPVRGYLIATRPK